MALISNQILQDYQAEDIKKNSTYPDTDTAALAWFENIDDIEFEEHTPTPYKNYIDYSQKLQAELYLDYVAGIYFLIKHKNTDDHD